MGDGDKIRIDWDDINRPEVTEKVERDRRFRQAAAHYEQAQQSVATGETDAGRRVYGTVAAIPSPASRGASYVLRSSITYTPACGLAAAFVAWMCLETLHSTNGTLGGASNALLQAAVFFGVVGALLGASLSAADDLMSGAYGKAFRASLVGAVVGVLSGACAGGLAQSLYGAANTSRSNVVMVLDVSGSMTGQPLEEVITASRRFLSELDADRDVRLGLVSFSNEGQVLCPLSQDRNRLATAIGQMHAEGATNMAAGLREALSLLQSERAGGSILLFSDGQPTSLPSGTIEELVLEELRNRGLSLAELEGMSETRQTEIFEAIRAGFEEKYLKQPQREAQQVADSVRRENIRIIAIGTAEADRSFLATIAGDSSQVLYARRGTISQAFSQAAGLLFETAGSGQGTQGLFVRSGVRALSWGFVGMMLGLVQGLAIWSTKKAKNGALGGLLGGIVGGALFDPIDIVLQTDWVSRLVALCIIGAATGVLIGIVESVLKDAWLLVTGGPLTGKQFVIYKNPTVFGSAPKADIYLFKDATVEPRHAALHTLPRGHELEDLGTPAGTLVNGRRIGRHRLRTGDSIQIGQYAFSYTERARARPGTTGRG
jgi:hypothetical protein